MRSPLLQHLYRVIFLGEVLDANPGIAQVVWHGNDPDLAAAAQAVAAVRQRSFEFRPITTRKPRSVRWLLARRLTYLGYAVTRWLMFRAFGLHRTGFNPNAQVVFFTAFPGVWDRNADQWRERMYGTLPDYIAAQGHEVLYAAVPYGTLRGLISRHRLLRRRSIELGICHLEARLTLSRLILSHATITLFVRYLRWRRAERRRPVQYRGIDVTKLLWREVDASVFGTAIPANVALFSSLSRHVQDMPELRVVFTNFEYQPSERAAAAAVHTRPGLKVVGTQAAMFTANQVGWNLFRPEITCAWLPGQRHHLPDLVCAYGELARRVFAQGLGSKRVEAVGGIRYTFEPGNSTAASGRGKVVLIATSSSRSESVTFLESVWSVLARRPELSAYVKFHPLLPLPDVLARLAKQSAQVRYEVRKDPLPQLLPQALAMVCGATSSAMESIVFGCMPLVFWAPGELTPNPMLHVPDAAFFWTTTDELEAEIESCLRADGRYRARVSAWPNAIVQHLGPRDGRTNDRVYAFLSKRAALGRRGGDVDAGVGTDDSIGRSPQV